MSVVNLFACLPIEILENEILSRLDLVSAVSLLIATRVAVSATARPVIFIRWKYLAAEGAPSFAMTTAASERFYVRVFVDIFKSPPTPLNNEFAYRSLEGLLRGAVVEPQAFNQIPRDTLYPVAVAVTGPRLPELMDILRVKFPEAHEKIDDVLALRRGEFPSVHRADSIINDYSPRYGIPPKTYVRYLSTVPKHGHAYWSIVSILTAGDKIAKCGLDTPELFPAMLESRMSLGCDWNKVPENIYSSAVASGYMWFLAETGILVNRLPDNRWAILVADFSSRTAGASPSRRACIIRDIGSEGVLLQRIPEITKLFTLDSIMSFACDLDKLAIYARIRAAVGASLFETSLLELDRGRLCGRQAASLIRSGGGYTQQLRDPRYVRSHMLDEALKVNNVKFLREFIMSGEKLHTQVLHADCIKSGHVECVMLALEFDLPITQKGLYQALFECHNLAIVNLYI